MQLLPSSYRHWLFLRMQRQRVEKMSCIRSQVDLDVLRWFRFNSALRVRTWMATSCYRFPSGLRHTALVPVHFGAVGGGTWRGFMLPVPKWTLMYYFGDPIHHCLSSNLRVGAGRVGKYMVLVPKWVWMHHFSLSLFLRLGANATLFHCTCPQVGLDAPPW